MLSKKSLLFIGFLQATGLTLYITLLACFFNFVLPNLPKTSESFFAPIVMLLIFIISAVTSSLLVLGRAGVLFWDKKYRQAFTLVGCTLGWLVFYLLFVLLIFFNF